MSLKIYGNLSMTGNASIATTHPHSSFEATVFQRGHHSHLALEAPVRQRGHSVPIAQPSMANAAPRRRRSSRIARRVKLRATPPRRRPLCSVHEDFDFWSNIWTLLIDLLQYVSPGGSPIGPLEIVFDRSSGTSSQTANYPMSRSEKIHHQNIWTWCCHPVWCVLWDLGG